MQFRRTPQFLEDFGGLDEADKTAVDEAFPNVVLALQGNVTLFSHHHIKKMQGWEGIWEGIWEGHVKGNNLCFTFHYDQTANGEKTCFFRRVGTHKIYKNP